MAVRSVDQKSVFKLNFNIYYVYLKVQKNMHWEYIVLNDFRKAKTVLTAGFHVPLTPPIIVTSRTRKHIYSGANSRNVTEYPLILPELYLANFLQV